jgi:hypothetical protein
MALVALYASERNRRQMGMLTGGCNNTNLVFQGIQYQIRNLTRDDEVLTIRG